MVEIENNKLCLCDCGSFTSNPSGFRAGHWSKREEDRQKIRKSLILYKWKDVKIEHLNKENKIF